MYTIKLLKQNLTITWSHVFHVIKFTLFTPQANPWKILKFAHLKFQWKFLFPTSPHNKTSLSLFSPNFASYFHIKTLLKTKFIRWTQPLVASAKLRPLCQHIRCFWLFWVCSVTSHARLAHVTQWHDPRLLLDFSHVFQNVSPCEITWKIRELPRLQAWCHARSEDVSTNDARRDFQDRLFSSGSNITELIFVTSYASY